MMEAEAVNAAAGQGEGRKVIVVLFILFLVFCWMNGMKSHDDFDSFDGPAP